LRGALFAGRARQSIRRRALRDLSAILILSGLLLLIDAGVTLLWQEPLTAVIGAIERGQINERYLSYRTAPMSAAEHRALALLIGPAHPARDRIAYLARREQRQLTPGDAVGRLEVPRLGGSYLVVQGTDEGSLEKGPGHYPSTSLPGLGQTVAIAGHRTTYLAPFRHLDALKQGDKLVLRMPYGRFVYAVQYRRIVSPTALWITRDLGYERLVLSACTPLFSAAQRIVVFARLASFSASMG
jgi:sortase A